MKSIHSCIVGTVVCLTGVAASSIASAEKPWRGHDIEPELVSAGDGHLQLRFHNTYDRKRLLKKLLPRQTPAQGRLNVTYSLYMPDEVASYGTVASADLRSGSAYEPTNGIGLFVAADGCYTGTYRVEYAFADATIGSSSNQIWFCVDSGMGEVVSEYEYTSRRLRTEVRQTASAADANLEPGDVPGEGRQAPWEPSIRCGEGTACR